jgi:metal-sulfur cluster biosynthetic enzyme
MVVTDIFEKTMITKEQILEKISEIYDPEISINIVELGLIYEVNINNDHVHVVMTLTSAWCPSANEIPAWVEAVCRSFYEIHSAKVEVTFTPEWGPDRISDAGKLELGIF